MRKEYNRQVRGGRPTDHFFCSRSCTRKWQNSNLSEEQKAHRSVRLKETQRRASRAGADVIRKGKFTYYLKKARARSSIRNHWGESDLTEEYLHTLWEKQDGKCAWTSIEMNITSYADRNNGLFNASLDRIDSTKGYIQGNVQFVLLPLNMAKGNRDDDDEFRGFLSAIGVITPT